MSGGSYEYVYRNIEDFASNLLANTPERKVFKVLLHKVAKAAHAIEWVDSCDKSKGDENPLILECVEKADILKEAIAEAIKARDTLSELIATCQERADNA